jgi:hypothetical protein
VPVRDAQSSTENNAASKQVPRTARCAALRIFCAPYLQLIRSSGRHRQRSSGCDLNRIRRPLRPHHLAVTPPGITHAPTANRAVPVGFEHNNINEARCLLAWRRRDNHASTGQRIRNRTPPWVAERIASGLEPKRSNQRCRAPRCGPSNRHHGGRSPLRHAVAPPRSPRMFERVIPNLV